MMSEEALLLVSNGRAVRACDSCHCLAATRCCRNRVNREVHCIDVYRRDRELQCGPNAQVFVVRRRTSGDDSLNSSVNAQTVGARRPSAFDADHDHSASEMLVDDAHVSRRSGGGNWTPPYTEQSQELVLKVAPGEQWSGNRDFRRRAEAEVRVLKLLAEPLQADDEEAPSGGDGGCCAHSTRNAALLHQSRLHLALPNEVWLEPDGRACMLFDRKPLDLFDFMRQRRWRGFAVRKAGHILRQICGALHCMHRCFNLVHNDVKPENILVDPETLHCWLADFGGTSAPQTTRDYDNTVATAYFVSPERMFCRPFDERSDAWSIGVLATELIHGKALLSSLFEEDAWRRSLRSILCDTEEEELLQRPTLLERLASAERASKNRAFAGYRLLLQKTLVVRSEDRCTVEHVADTDQQMPLKAFLRRMTHAALAK